MHEPSGGSCRKAFSKATASDLVMLNQWSVQTELAQQLFPVADKAALAAVAGTRQADVDQPSGTALLPGQYQHAIGEVDRLLQIMRDHDHGGVLLAPDAGE